MPEDLGGGVWSVPVPIPGNPLAYTLVYALDGPRGPVLVDAGWQHEDAWSALKNGLAVLGLDVGDVSGVVVTHFHPDHAGLAGRVREASGAWVAMHRADAALLATFRGVVEQDSGGTWELDALRRAGAAEGELAGYEGRERVDPPAAPDRELDDGELVDLPGRTLRAVWTPGHTPGHLCLHLEDGDRIFTGDHVLPRITPHIGLYPYDTPGVDPLGDFLASLARVAQVPAGEVLPAHQYRFRGLAERAEAIAAHHEERLAEVTALLSAEPATLWRLAAGMTWRAPWDAMPLTSRRMAAGEAAAHLRALERRGIARRQDAGGSLGFVLTSAPASS
ncbi:MBL fold metallo-hydrolase [Actinomadura viridis]|uniref:Glyoxylase-like metal-dependent hydrolase (Beta-lactamase superfamily II) n=1 Tax=Actinomadura viridis TaxID=58110 RepID=A0A931DIV9_9ACTN|nr:MBL fold metallo-hydrolase [Actinomadura viridis]MBG6087533.1 glyoxylase-like metal-dependent hydrolase (beta-lactamase superfamily II) [Actinomadura viridis]